MDAKVVSQLSPSALDAAIRHSAMAEEQAKEVLASSKSFWYEINVLPRFRNILLAWWYVWQSRPGGRADRLARIDPNEKCPACGWRQGKIHWTALVEWSDKTKGAIVHRCEVCAAFWFKKPLVPSEKWVVDLAEPPKE
jgi:formate dehydrogenase maturation protein FdhE